MRAVEHSKAFVVGKESRAGRGGGGGSVGDLRFYNHPYVCWGWRGGVRGGWGLEEGDYQVGCS